MLAFSLKCFRSSWTTCRFFIYLICDCDSSISANYCSRLQLNFVRHPHNASGTPSLPNFCRRISGHTRTHSRCLFFYMTNRSPLCVVIHLHLGPECLPNFVTGYPVTHSHSSCHVISKHWLDRRIALHCSLCCCYVPSSLLVTINNQGHQLSPPCTIQQGHPMMQPPAWPSMITKLRWVSPRPAFESMKATLLKSVISLSYLSLLHLKALQTDTPHICNATLNTSPAFSAIF